MHHQVVAERVERIDIEPTALGCGQAFFQFQVEDQVTKALAFDQIAGGYSERYTEERRCG
jgi:hypothetical protein